MEKYYCLLQGEFQLYYEEHKQSVNSYMTITYLIITFH